MSEIVRFTHMFPEKVASVVAGLVKKDSNNMEVVRVARQIMSGIVTTQQGSKYKILSRVSACRAVLEYVRSHVNYIPDPYGSEVIETPNRIVRHIKEKGQWSGDCDDIAGLTGALLRSIGFQVRLRLVALSADRGYQHIYAEAFIPAKEIQWVGIDPCLADHEAVYVRDQIKRSHFALTT